MKTVLFVNTRHKQCAVHQYGANLCAALNTSEKLAVHYTEPGDAAAIEMMSDTIAADAVLYNWHPTQGGFLKDAPFNVGRPMINLCVFHEIEFPTEKFDAVLYSKTHFIDRERWHHIPLVIPCLDAPPFFSRCRDESWRAVIGVSGYGGANADKVVAQVVEEFESARIRLHLPAAHYGDADGGLARGMAERCQKIAESRKHIALSVLFDWLEQDELLHWLSNNDLNCYLRDTTTPWTGVSAAMCSALAVHRPMAITRSQCFRHLWNCHPSICVENRSLKAIMATGTVPLHPIYEQNSTAKLVVRIETILEGIL